MIIVIIIIIMIIIIMIIIIMIIIIMIIIIMIITIMMMMMMMIIIIIIVMVMVMVIVIVIVITAQNRKKLQTPPLGSDPSYHMALQATSSARSRFLNRFSCSVLVLWWWLVVAGPLQRAQSLFNQRHSARRPCFRNVLTYLLIALA